MLAAGFTGLSYASLASRYPKAGGAAYSTYRAFRSSFLSYLVGMCALASGLTSMATASKVFAGYFVGLTGMFAPMPVALGFAVLVAFLVFWGIRESLFANGICTLIELGGLLLILVVGFSFVGSVDYLDATSATNPTGEISFSLIFTGAVLTFYSFVGFEDAMNVSEEVKDPVKNMPKGLILAVLISSVVYMGISIVAVSVISPTELAASKQPLVDVVAKAAPWFPSVVFSFVAMFAVANTALLNFIMGSRLLYGMGNQKIVPAVLSKVHPKRRTPHIAVLAVLALFIILIFSGDISSLAKSTSVLLLFCFMIVNSALIALKKKEKMKGTFEVPYFVPVLGIIICAAMLTKAKAPELMTAGVILGVAIVLFLIMRPDAKAVEAMEN